MTLKKIVDGVEVDMTPEEEAAMLAEWEAATAPVVPREVSMAQARLALLGAGLLSAVDTAINAMPEPAKSAARISWEYRQTVRRESELTLSLASALGLTSQEVDELFIQAATL